MDAFEHDVRTTLVAEVERVEIPPCDPAALAQAGRQVVRRRRVRTAWASVGTAAAVALVLLVVSAVAGGSNAQQGPAHHGQSTGTPSPSTPTSPVQSTRPVDVASLPHGPLPEQPYWERGTLHWGSGHSARLGYSFMTVAGGRVLVDSEHGADNAQVLRVLMGGRLRTLPVSNPLMQQISPDGRYVVWETAPAVTGPGASVQGKRVRFTVFDLDTWSVVAQKSLPAEGLCCSGVSPYVAAVDSHRRVFIFADDGDKVWDFATGAMRPLSGLPASGIPAGATLSGLSVTDNAGTAYGTVDESGAFHRQGQFIAQESRWSPDGREVVHPHFLGAQLKAQPTGWIVHDITTGTTRPLMLPRAGGVRLQPWELSWESDSTLLVAATAGSHEAIYWLRVDVATGHTELIKVFPPNAQRGLGLNFTR